MLNRYILQRISYKNIPNKLNFIKNFVDNTLNVNTKFINIFLIFLVLLLLSMKLLNLYFSYELNNNLDNFVTVYN